MNKIIKQFITFFIFEQFSLIKLLFVTIFLLSFIHQYIPNCLTHMYQVQNNINIRLRSNGKDNLVMNMMLKKANLMLGESSLMVTLKISYKNEILL